MCVVQIGELVALLSDAVKQQSTDVPWRVIKTRGIFTFIPMVPTDVRAVWDTLEQDIPALESAKPF